MAKVQWKKLFIYGLSALLIISIGCSKSNNPSPKPSGEKPKSKKLIELQSSIDALQKEFESYYLQQMAPSPPSPSQGEQAQGKGGSQGQDQQGEEKGGSKEGEASSGGGGGGGEGKGEEEGGEQQSPAKESGGQEGKQPDWRNLEELVTKVHEGWNEFLPEVAKAGASRDKMESFSRGLDAVTMAITGQDLYSGLLFANEIYYENIGFEKLFDSDAPPELKEVIYFLRKGAYQALNSEGEAAMISMTKAQERWADIKPQLEPHQSFEQVEFSLKDLEQAITAQDPNLIKIRTKIAKGNVKQVMEQQAQQKKESGQK